MGSLRIRSFVAGLVCLVAHRVRAQQPPATVELSVPDIISIASDVDQGRDALYCYHGRRIDGPTVHILVDSVTRIATQHDCRGVGIAFVVRVLDRQVIAAAIRGVIDDNPGLDVVSAFYRTEDIEHDGLRLHAPRALSVVRGVVVPVITRGS